MNIQTLKGFRDFLPQEAKKREYVINILKMVFTSYGFEPLETPALEYEEILKGKYGDEGDKLMYKFEDNGKRKVAMRYDQTVPLARVVAQYQNDLPLPFKRYQIQNVWRAENTQKGRYREFLQVDADIVGSYSLLSDAEVLSLVYTSYKSLGLDIQILINDRKNLSNIENKYLSAIDKVGKVEEREIIKEMESKGMSIEEAEKTFNEVKNKPEPSSIIEVRNAFKEMGNPPEIIQYRSVLVRGLDYYTGLIFEVIIKGSEKFFSLGGGGRYDNLIGMFAGKEIPAVGFAFGFDRLIEAMNELNLFPANLAKNGLLVAFASSNLQQKAMEIAQKLREKGINVDFYLDDSSLEKQLKYANKKQIQYVLIVGEKLELKDMETGEQKEVNVEQLPDEIK